MAQGLTKSEQVAILIVIVLIVAGLMVQGRRSNDDEEGFWIEPSPGFQLVRTPAPVNFAATEPLDTEPAQPAKVSPPAPAGEVSPAAIDINSASAAELDRLPGIGPAKARAIIRRREAFGPFETVEELQQVSGIGPKILERVIPYIVAGGAASSPLPNSAAPPAIAGETGSGSEAPVAPPRGQGADLAALGSIPIPVNINQADAEQLQLIPGVGPEIAHRIIRLRDIRNYGRPEHLLEVKGIGPKSFEKMRPWVKVE